MNKYFFICCLLLITGTVFAQKKTSFLHVIKSDSTLGTKRNGVDLLVIYRAVFQQDNTILSSDSAYFYQKANTCDAFGHVIITQGDTLHVFGDKLNYNGNTKQAIVTDNVRLIDRDAILTTNYFTYNTGTKYGTYTGGGKLVNKDNVLISKNGYYLASSRDAYFRYDVVLTTPDAVIKTDTLRYNSTSRIAYFYGPTNIYGKKDKDTLYTENGTYNTQTEQAFFGKKNLYRQGTKSLKGDSLFYDRLVGYGKAVKHVTFMDTEQKIVMKGGLGEYFKKEERTLMTVHPYVVFVTEEKDTTKRDTLRRDSITLKGKTGIVQKQALLPPKNSVPVTDAAYIDKAHKALNEVPQSIKDSVINKVKANIAKSKPLLPLSGAVPVIDQAQINALNDMAVKTLNGIPKKDTLANKSNIAKAKPNRNKKAGGASIIAPVPKKDTLLKKDTSHIKRDSIFMTADSIETRIITFKTERNVREERRIAGMRDTSVKRTPSIVYTKPVKYIDIAPLHMRGDTNIFRKDYFTRAVKKDTSQHKVTLAPPKKVAKPVVKRFLGIDSVSISQDVVLADTARIRFISAAHHAKIFKSDLQAKADSIYFSYSDSVARMYVKPMIWAQGSQISADTINMQMKKKQLDNLLMAPNSMIVNIEKGDSTHFNQVGGKKMRGFFRDSKLFKMFVFGNAETIYFDRDSGKVTQMFRSISSSIKVSLKNNEPTNVMWYIKPDQKVTPIAKLKEEDKTLRNFIWRPQDRPVSKESIINPPPVDKQAVKKGPGKADTKKPAVTENNRNIGKAEKPDIKSSRDSVKLIPDSLRQLNPRADTLKTKPHEPAKQ